MNLKLYWLFIVLFFSTCAIAQSTYHNEWIDYNKTYYKCKVMGFGTDNVGAPVRKGMVRIPYAALSSAGLAGVSSQYFQLWRDGEEVAVYVSKPSGVLSSADYIEFFGEINNGKLDKELYRDPDFQLADKWSLQTDTAAYFLTVNTVSANKRLETVNNNVAQNTLSAETYFMQTVGRYFRQDISNGFSASLGQNLYSSSYDRGEGWVSRAIRPVAGCGTATLPQSFVNLYPFLDGPKMTLRVNAVGDAQNSRTVTIKLDDDSISTFQMDYINYVKNEDLIDVKKISSGTATFYLVNKSPSGCDEMRAAMIELTYPRIFNMGGASVFDFVLPPSESGRYLEIVNFNHGGVPPVLYDLANGKRYIGDISNSDTVKILLESSDVEYNLVLTTQAGSYYKEIDKVQSRKFIDYLSTENQGNYLIISNPLIYGTGADNYVEQYRQYRASATGGLYDAKVIDINELTDQFAWGVKKHPLAIKNFLRYARNYFSNSPQYVFLIGKGVIYNEYRANESNPLAEKLNLVPTWGNPASDNLLASDDFNAIPAIPIGRLSAVTPFEVRDYLLKVKQHDSAQKSKVQTIEAKSWMKNVIQIAGANDIGLGDKLDGYLENYKKIISGTPFGANVIGFSKTANPAGYPEAVNSFKKIYESGASLITYFGHSSSTSLDFNLDNPETYNNPEKYPIFIANGCSAGNHFLFEPDRLNTKSTISEKFVLSPQRGAIGYLASTHFGVINYLDLYTNDFYKALANTSYNQTVGTVVKEAITSSLDSTDYNDYYSRVHAEQYAFHGDPAITINSSLLPDYVIEEPQIQVSPSFISVADSVFKVKVKVYNIGKAANDSVTFKISRQSPNGEITSVISKTFAPIYLVDSVTVNIPIVANRDKGLNTITAVIDYNDQREEISNDNNGATVVVNISEEEIKPVYPYKYAVITEPDIKLSASTVNPLSTSKEYVMELDTTALFNSSVKITKSVVSAGGVIEFDPGILYADSTTYYWRVAPVSPLPHWVNSSFVYKSKSFPGFQQGHIYQNLQSEFSKISLDSTTRNYSYEQKLHNLFITNSVYSTSGSEDQHFSISVDGSTFIASACAGHSVIFNVFDPLSFTPQKNTTQPFNAAPVCNAGREHNFEYQYLTAETRKNAMDFLDAIPTGSYVSVRLILDEPYSTFVTNWAADTALFGKGNSLYHRLKENGFTAIDSFTYPRTWAFVFKKGDPSFTPTFKISDGVYDRITLSVNCVTSNAEGEIVSPVFGPATQWKNVNWNGYSQEEGNDKPILHVYGVRNDNTDTLLYSIDNSMHSFDISAVNVHEFPFVKLGLINTDSVTATPYQLTDWSIDYAPVPEGAVAPNLYFAIPDTVSTLRVTSNDTGLHIGFAFKNVSKTHFDSLAVKVTLTDSLNNQIVYPVYTLRPLNSGDTLHVDLPVNISSLNGLYNLYVEVNPVNYQAEQYHFNNFLYKYVYIDNPQLLPVTLLDFAAILQGSQVSAKWSVTAETNTSRYEVQRSVNGISFTTVGSVAASAGSERKSYSFIDLNPADGKNYYRLKMYDNDGSYTFSAVQLVTVNNATDVKIYPNPVNDILIINIARHDGKLSDVKLMSAVGQQLWHRKMNDSAGISMKHYASGTYIIQIDDGNTVKTYKIQKQ